MSTNNRNYNRFTRGNVREKKLAQQQKEDTQQILKVKI